MEQLMRDSRITQLYEGTNGIQALDLIRRKLLGDGGAELNALIDEFTQLAEAAQAHEPLREMAQAVSQRLREWRELGQAVIAACQRDPQEIGAVSVDFLAYSAYVLLAGFWLTVAFIKPSCTPPTSTGGACCRAPVPIATPCSAGRTA
jgi:hypothetical protein